MLTSSEIAPLTLAVMVAPRLSRLLIRDSSPIEFGHGHLRSKRQLLHDAVKPRDLIGLDFLRTVHPQKDFVAESVADAVRDLSKDENDQRALLTA